MRDYYSHGSGGYCYGHYVGFDPADTNKKSLDDHDHSCSPFPHLKDLDFRGDTKNHKPVARNLSRSMAAAKAILHTKPIELVEWFERGVSPGDSPFNLENIKYKFKIDPVLAEAAVLAEITGHNPVIAIPEGYIDHVPKFDQGFPDPDKEAEIINKLVNDKNWQPGKEAAEHALSLARKVIEKFGPKHLERLPDILTRLSNARKLYNVSFAAGV